VNYIWAITKEVGLDEIASYMMVQPLSVDSSVTVLYAALLLGGVLHIVGYEGSLDARQLADYTSRHTIDCMKIAPPHLQSVMDSLGGTRILPKKLLIVGGDVSHWEWIERLGELAPDCRIFNHYGPTETTVGVTTYGADGAGEHGSTGSVPIGRALNNTQIYILDARLEPVPVGVIGDLYIGGVPVVRGYLGRPDLTADSFIPNPFAEDGGERLYRTGDRARYLRDGNIEFLGRRDDQLKVRGYRIEPDEIANVVMEHGAVRQAVVVPTTGHHHERILAAYVVLADGASAAPEELRSHLQGKLPSYMVPANVVVLDALPLTPHGKIDRRALPAPEGRPEIGAYVAPRTPTEEALASIWCEVLRLDRVGIEDNFFELGGHSLLAISLISGCNRALKTNLQIRSLFDHPTIESLAEIVRKNQPLPPYRALVPLQTAGDCLPLFCIAPSGGSVFCYTALASELGPNQPTYGLQSSGLEPGEALPASVEAMAASYIDAIRAVQPEGPYRLLGYSFGGLVAYEMAYQLGSADEHIELLALGDTAVPNNPEAKFHSSFMAEIVNSIKTFVGPNVNLDRLLETARSGKPILPEFLTTQGERIAAVYINETRLRLAYRPRQGVHSLLLIRATEQAAGTEGYERNFNWSPFLLHEPITISIACNHASLLSPPSVKLIVDALRPWLSRNDASRDGRPPRSNLDTTRLNKSARDSETYPQSLQIFEKKGKL
jgi:thioesterase domain-containing protein